MKFKKLEIAGFKSFADRLEVKFGAGITAIVGPNGCGKSNVADSIRWVLGEQSAKLLRGSSMQDVIFNGTENRKSLSYCEVNLYFDNTGKCLFPNLDYDEVVITRKLYRNGESEYCLNRSVCRLKEITELLRDGGMGREGYSIIGQGRIEELLRAKPEDRRAIFEEAAGISKFKVKKIESERKLARMRENLVRIEDILHEKSVMLEPLSKQAEAARKWLELRERLKIHEINIYIHQYESASQAKAAIAARLEAVINEIAEKQAECDSATAGFNEAREKHEATDKTVNGLRDELLNLTVDIEKAMGNVKVLKERLSYLNAQNEQLQSDLGQDTEDLEQAKELIETNKSQTAEVEQALIAARAEIERISREYLDVIDTLAQGEGEAESNRRTVMEAMDKLTELRSSMSRLIAEREGLNAAVADLDRRLAAVREKYESGIAATAKLSRETELRVKEKNELTGRQDALYEENARYVAEIAKIAERLDVISAKYHEIKTRHNMLVGLQESYDGFVYSVKKLMLEAKTNKELASKIEGVVASLLSVNEGYETAIEMALGQSVQNIVTKTEEDAKYLVNYLKQMRAGRATFLPVTAAKPRSLDPEYRRYLSDRGVCGIASQLVSFDAKYSAVFEGMLGNTVIVEDMDTAVALARKTRYGFKIVTKGGEVLSPHGSITGGSQKTDSVRVFGYEKEIEHFAAKIAEMDKLLAELNARRAELADKQNTAAEQIRVTGEAIHKLDLEIATRTEALSKFEIADEELSTQLAELQAEREAAESRIQAISKDVDSVGELEQIALGRKDSANESGEEQRAQFDALRKKRDELHEKMTAARVNETTLQARRAALDNELSRLNNAVEAITAKIEYEQGKIADNASIIADLDATITASTTAENSRDSVRVREIRDKLSNLGAYKDELNAAVAELDARRMAIMDEIAKLNDRRSREEIQLAKVDTDIEVMQQKVYENYNLQYDDCLPFKEQDYDLTKGIAEANRITRQMNALGHVNLDAIEQSQEMFKSYHEMDVQREDIVKAAADLTKIINEMSAEMLEKFTGQFEQIRKNFVKIFKELFDGGNADLVLLDSENPLDAGIEIVAQPPEKKLQSISLLSGGERALTAIAILFAILRLKPMPFCVLDEIEAALDDANAGRFAKYLRRFSEDTQFIVITHRKPTMELADSLYGVTMEEKGVSKIVSVKLSEAIKMEDQQ